MKLVEEWLNSINLLQYSRNFDDNGYDDFDVIVACMTDAKLQAIGVLKVGHRDKIILDLEKRKIVP